MKKRSRAGGEPIQGRRRKAPKPKGRNAPKAVARSIPSPTNEETEVARLTRELSEAREQQTATSDVLQVISSFAGELDPVFQTILANATRICEAKFGALYLKVNDGFRATAMHNAPPAYEEARAGIVHPPPSTSLWRAANTKQAVQKVDVTLEPGYIERDPFVVSTVALGGFRSVLSVPMLHEDKLVGVITIFRQEVRPFTDRQIDLVKNFAAQAVIAIANARLLNELRQRTTDLTERTADLTETLEQQTATSEVLQVISSSPGNLQPVFATMLGKAVRMCAAKFGTLYLHEEGGFRLVAGHEVPEFIESRGSRPIQPAPGGGLDTAMRTKRTAHLPDLAATQSYAERHPRMVEAVELGGMRTVVAVPMLKDNDLVGVIAVFRREVRPFSDKQVALMENFASQAVIAIDNARLLNELRQSLERQTATSEVLQVISTSPSDLEPVFATMLGKAVSICDAKFGTLYLREGDGLRLIATHDVPPAFVETQRYTPFRPAPEGMLDAVMKTGRTVHLADLAETRSYIERDPRMVDAVEVGGIRTVVGVPLLKDNELIGLIGIYRQEVRPFAEKQIALLTNFAAQAVIAIENARLLNELRQRTTDLTERTTELTEALEQQTATSEVLQVISSSPGDLQPVFAAMVENAVRICHANWGNIHRWEDEALHLVASHNPPPAFAAFRRSTPDYPPHPKALFGRLLATKTVTQIIDCAAVEAYTERLDPVHVAAVELGGARTALAVPMLKNDQLIGAFALIRQEIQPFTDKQIELVKSFAAQAVIAIENARLLSELRQRTTDLSEALEQQTATSEVLQVISSSPGDLEPVFAAMLEKAVRICDATFGNLFRFNGNTYYLAAGVGTPLELAEFQRQHRSGPFQPDPGSQLELVMRTKQVSHIADAAAEASPGRWATLGGARTYVVVPMIKDEALIGVVVVYRQEIRPFTDRQIALVQNFANQAVIAIENARLLNELRQRTVDLTEALDQQTVTSQILQVISSSTGDVQPVFEAVLMNAVRLCDAKFGMINYWNGEALYLAAAYNAPAALVEFRKSNLLRPRPENFSSARILMSNMIIHCEDLTVEQEYLQRLPLAVAAVELGGVRTFLAAPMFKESSLIGAIIIYRQEVRPFTDKQIELLKNFAAQAAIAIENSRLLRELRELNQQLERRVTDQVDEIERMSRLRRFLPPQVADLIVASGSEKQLESHRREITALFCDLRGFTGFTESADAEDIMALLRDYHAAIGEIIIKYNGTLERYAGDGVMVIFNDPVPVENPALQAVLMALEVRDAIGALTETWRRLGHDIGFGIGIAHGFATLGTIGFEGRFDYAAIGTVSNVASRLCDEAKPGQILISPRVLMKVENAVQVEPVGEFELKGIRRPLAAYNVVNASS